MSVKYFCTLTKAVSLIHGFTFPGSTWICKVTMILLQRLLYPPIATNKWALSAANDLFHHGLDLRK